jgi:hypothetical protein
MASERELDLIMSQLSALADFQTFDKEEKEAFRQDYKKGQLEDWRKYVDVQTQRKTEYERREIEQAIEKERKEFDKQLKSLANALPNVSKGVLNAVSAFQSNDPFTGSAAVMDICASVIPLLAGLSSAGGPPGMVVGAIFSMIGQILSFFAPQSKSLSDEIKDVLTSLKADDKEQQIGTTQDLISSYTISLRAAALDLNAALADSKIATDPAFATAAASKASVLAGRITGLNQNAEPGLWDVARWLREEKNYGEDKWPLVLAAWCQAYADLLFTARFVGILTNTDGMRSRLDELKVLPSTDRAKLENALGSVRDKAFTVLNQQKGLDSVALGHVRALVAPARDRGLLWQLDDANELFGGSQIRRGTFEYLRAQGKRIAVAASEEDLKTSVPTYHIFHVEPGDTGRLFHGLWRYPYKKPPVWDDLGSTVEGLTDVWATYGSGDDPKEIYFHGTKGNQIIGYVLDRNAKVRDGNYTLTLKSTALAVRVVRDPSWLADDPDVDPEGLGLQAHPYLVYGGAESSSGILVAAEGLDPAEVPSPWTEYRGLGVDDTYVWVFGSGGFACATHASIVRCLANKEDFPEPRWMTHYPPKEMLYHSSYTGSATNRPPRRGLLSLSPCDDGTLMAAIAMYMTSIAVIPRPMLYTAVYHTDVKAKTITVDWKKLPDTTAGAVVQKVPVACWPMLEELYRTLPQFAGVD